MRWYGLGRELENELEAVLVVPLLARLHEAELADDRQRGLVAGRNRSDEVRDAAGSGPLQQCDDRLGRVAPAAVVAEDRIANLERPSPLGAVDSGLAVE